MQEQGVLSIREQLIRLIKRKKVELPHTYFLKEVVAAAVAAATKFGTQRVATRIKDESK